MILQEYFLPIFWSYFSSKCPIQLNYNSLKILVREVKYVKPPFVLKVLLQYNKKVVEHFFLEEIGVCTFH